MLGYKTTKKIYHRQEDNQGRSLSSRKREICQDPDNNAGWVGIAGESRMSYKEKVLVLESHGRRKLKRQ